MYIYRLVFLLVLTLYMFSPVVTEWWAEPGSTWYRPYIIWLALIGISIWLESRRGPNEF